MIRFSYGFDFSISLTKNEEYWWRIRSEMKGYKTLIENSPFGVDALRSLHLQWINLEDYRVEYEFDRIN